MAFRRNDIKRRHEITHSKEYRYFCAICGKGFIRRYVLVKHLTRDHNTSDSKEIVYQNKKKDNNEKGVPNTVQESDEQSVLSDLQQLENDVEMKATTEDGTQPEETYSLVPTDVIPEGSEVVQIEGLVEEDDEEETMEKGNENQIAESEIAGNQMPENEIPVDQINENDPNIHVTAILTSSLEEKPVLKDIKVKDEGTQIT